MAILAIFADGGARHPAERGNTRNMAILATDGRTAVLSTSLMEALSIRPSGATRETWPSWPYDGRMAVLSMSLMEALGIRPSGRCKPCTTARSIIRGRPGAARPSSGLWEQA
jgi:hypothetical protein